MARYFADQDKFNSVIDEVLKDTDQYLSMVTLLSEIVSEKLPEQPKVLLS
ncbi:MAG: hypothetical protein ACKVHL_05330 [Rhodospirillales bacterium]|jgi:hypothetical protein